MHFKASFLKIGLFSTIPMAGLGIYYVLSKGRRLTEVLFKRRESLPEVPTSHGKQMMTSEEAKEAECLVLLNEVKPHDLWNTALFFPDRDPKAPGSVTSQFLSYFEQARYSIQICVFLFSYRPLSDILLKKFNSGCLIQIVTDYDTMDPRAHCNYFNFLKRRGLPVRFMSFGGFMHHKFAVIDEVAVILGSLNWTKQGITMNRENIIITTDKRYVRPYLEEFRKIWLEFRDSPFNSI